MRGVGRLPKPKSYECHRIYYSHLFEAARDIFVLQCRFTESDNVGLRNPQLMAGVVA